MLHASPLSFRFSSLLITHSYFFLCSFFLLLRPLGAGPVELVTPCASYIQSGNRFPVDGDSGGSVNDETNVNIGDNLNKPLSYVGTHDEGPERRHEYGWRSRSRSKQPSTNGYRNPYHFYASEQRHRRVFGASAHTQANAHSHIHSRSHSRVRERSVEGQQGLGRNRGARTMSGSDGVDEGGYQRDGSGSGDGLLYGQHMHLRVGGEVKKVER
jgi:hypothetical protein